MMSAEWLVSKTISVVYALIPRRRPPQIRLAATRLVAHRGIHEDGLARENSLKAFDLCLENKIWAAELDVRFTADDIPIVVHDEDGRRNWQSDITFATSTFGQIREKIPDLLSLREIVERYGKKLHLMIEIKENHLANPRRVNILAEMLKPLTPVDDYHLLALDPKILEPLLFAPKKAYLDVIWLDAKTVFRENEKLAHGAIAGHFLFFSRKRLSELKARKISIGVGFLDSKNSLYREINRGADFIFTDYALRLQRILTLP